MTRRPAAWSVVLAGLALPPVCVAQTDSICEGRPGDVDGDGVAGTSDMLVMLGAWGPCAGCAADLDGDGAVGTSDLLTLLAGWGSPPPSHPDSQYLYRDLEIDVFETVNGPSFTARRADGLLLRKQVDDEVYFVDYTNGALGISYEIRERCAGVDIAFTVVNPTSTAKRLPELRLEGLRQAVNGDAWYLNVKDSGTIEPADPSLSTFINWPYPNAYSPVLVTLDDEFAAGSGLLYPYFEYRHDVTLLLEKVQGGPLNRTWRHRYATRSSARIPPGAIWKYTVAVRFGPPRYWLLTTHPYKAHYESQFGPATARPADRRPIYKLNVASRGDYDPVDNPRGYNEDLGVHSDGWSPLVDTVIADMAAQGFERFHLWVPSGSYSIEDGCPDLPPQFMDFLPHLDESADAFHRFGEAGYELGFWWGRAAQVPYGLDETGWNPASCENADYLNAGHMDFLAAQFAKAVQRGAAAVGLDAFARMPAWQRPWWIADMQQMGPDTLLVHEGSGPDFLHALIANYYAPHRWGRATQLGPDLLSRYLGNGGSEIWVTFLEDDHVSTAEMLQEHIRWGFTPILTGSSNQLDIRAFDTRLARCFDGEDNDGDGLVDFPYDPGCADAADDSE